MRASVCNFHFWDMAVEFVRYNMPSFVFLICGVTVILSGFEGEYKAKPNDSMTEAA